MILPIKHTLGWELKCQRNQAKINKYNIRKNSTIVYHYYTVRDKVMLNNNSSLKYEIPYKGIFDITQQCVNGTVTLQCVVINIRYNIRHIKSYTSNTNVEYTISKTNLTTSHFNIPVIYFSLYIYTFKS